MIYLKIVVALLCIAVGMIVAMYATMGLYLLFMLPFALLDKLIDKLKSR